jgi:hypothetical protein
MVPLGAMLATASPALALTHPIDTDMKITSLLIARAETRLTQSRALDRRPTSRFPFSSTISTMDRFDLASVRTRSARATLGSVDVMLSANRAANIARREDVPFDVDRWTLKGIGLSAELPLGSDMTLSIGGDYARMTRRLKVVEVNARRLGTSLAKIGMGLGFADRSRLALDYVSVSRSSSHNDLTRLAETVGGAPLTGHGPELSFTTHSGGGSGGISWKFSLASMQRPTRDLGYVGGTDSRSDARAMVGFSLHL